MKKYLVGARMRTVKYGICWLCSLIQDIQDNSLALVSVNNHEIAEFLDTMNDYMVKHVKSELSLETGNILITYFFRLFPIDKNFIEKYETDLKDALNNCLKDSKWMIGSFLSIAVGYRCLSELKKYYFYEELDNKVRFFKKINDDIQVVEQLVNSERQVRPLNVSDLIKIEVEAKIYFSEKIFFLYSNVRAADVFKSELAMNLLEVAQKTKGKTIGTFDNSKVIYSENNIEINNEMAKLIRFGYYKLDKDLSEKGIFPVSRYSAQEVVSLLNISKDELIALCFSQSFGVYIKEGNYKIHRSIHSPITREDITQDEKLTYPYFYKGHFRLQKTSQFYSENSTLEKIYKGGMIEVPAGRDHIFVPIQPSLSELVQGEHILLELRGNQKISINDLVFIKNEIHDYIENQQGNTKLVEENITSPHVVEMPCTIVALTSINLSQKTGRGLHNRKKREEVLSLSVAVIFQRNSVNSGKSIAKAVDATLTGTKLSFDKITRCINQWLHPLDQVETKLKTRKLTKEIVYGMIVAAAYTLKDQFLSKDFKKSVELVSSKVHDIFTRVGYRIEHGVVKNFVANSADQILKNENFSQ